MNQKVVFLDVDGTIVNDKGIIPESTQIAIRKAVENGHKLVVCSGRSLFQLPQMLLDLGFSGMVTAAGAQVIADGKEIYHAVIDEEHRKFIVDYMEKNNFVYCFQTDAGVVMNKRSEQQILNIMSDMGITEEHLRQLIGEFFIVHIVDSAKRLVKYSWLLQVLVERDLKIRYRRSFLGYLWSVLNPLLMMIILTIVFSNMFRFDIPQYPVYLLAGQLIFGFYSEATSMAMGSILGGAALIKKVYLPKYIFPLSRVISSFTSMLLSMIALFIVIIATDVTFSITIILLPFILVQVLVFCIGMGLLLSVLVVFFRDVQYLYSIFLTAFNYLTPIFYPESLLPEWLRELLVFNPLYNYIKFFRKITVYGQWPTMTEHLICLAFTFCMLVIGLYVFKRKQNDFILYI